MSNINESSERINPVRICLIEELPTDEMSPTPKWARLVDPRPGDKFSLCIGFHHGLETMSEKWAFRIRLYVDNKPRAWKLWHPRAHGFGFIWSEDFAYNHRTKEYSDRPEEFWFGIDGIKVTIQGVYITPDCRVIEKRYKHTAFEWTVGHGDVKLSEHPRPSREEWKLDRKRKRDVEVDYVFSRSVDSDIVEGAPRQNKRPRLETNSSAAGPSTVRPRLQPQSIIARHAAATSSTTAPTPRHSVVDLAASIKAEVPSSSAPRARARARARAPTSAHPPPRSSIFTSREERRRPAPAPARPNPALLDRSDQHVPTGQIRNIARPKTPPAGAKSNAEIVREMAERQDRQAREVAQATQRRRGNANKPPTTAMAPPARRLQPTERSQQHRPMQRVPDWVQGQAQLWGGEIREEKGEDEEDEEDMADAATLGATVRPGGTSIARPSFGEARWKRSRRG